MTPNMPLPDLLAAIARNAKALAAEPGRLSYKENTIWDFQRYLPPN